MVPRNLVAAVALFLASASMAWPTAQQPAGPRAPARGQGRGGPRPPTADPLALEDRTGFDSMFDGKSLTGWDGDPRYWRAENGAILGESTPDKPVTENTFLIWQGGEPADFELKLEFRINSTNSGVQFRSVRLPQGGSIAGKWVLKGYQADIDFDNNYTGMLYEERGRGFLARRGQAVYFGPPGTRPRIIGQLERTADELKAIIKTNDWNQVHVIARGSMLTNILNGHVTSLLVDDDTAGRALKGLIGFQMHVGAPMRVEFRNVAIKQLS